MACTNSVPALPWHRGFLETNHQPPEIQGSHFRVFASTKCCLLEDTRLNAGIAPICHWTIKIVTTVSMVYYTVFIYLNRPTNTYTDIHTDTYRLYLIEKEWLFLELICYKYVRTIYITGRLKKYEFAIHDRESEIYFNATNNKNLCLKLFRTYMSAE